MKYKIKHKIVCVDVDGVIFDSMGKGSLEEYNPLKWDAKVFSGCTRILQKFLDLGWEVVINSARFDIDWDKNRGFLRMEIVEALKIALFKNHIPYTRISLVKPVADIYIDDRGFTFKNWVATKIWLERVGVFPIEKL